VLIPSSKLPIIQKLKSTVVKLCYNFLFTLSMCLYCLYIYIFVLSIYICIVYICVCIVYIYVCFSVNIYVFNLSIYVFVLQEKGAINRRRLDTVLNSCGARLQPGKFYVITGNAPKDCQPVECNKAY